MLVSIVNTFVPSRLSLRYSLFAGTLFSIYTFVSFPVLITITLGLLFLTFFVTIIFLSQVWAVSCQVVLDCYSGSLELCSLLIAQLGLENGRVLLKVIWVKFFLATLFKIIVFKLALEVFAFLGDHVEYLEAG